MPPVYHHYIAQMYELNPPPSDEPISEPNRQRAGRIEHAAHLNLEMQQSRERTQAMTQKLRPTSTKNAYYPKMSEFCDWCDKRPFSETTRYQVNGDQLHFFLEDAVSRVFLEYGMLDHLINITIFL